MSLDWLIIGGGIHGVHIATRLLGEAQVSPSRLRIVDPGDRFLERWTACTATTGMSHLRSSSVQHLDPKPQSLRLFAGRPKRGRRDFAAPYNRPALDLFNAHCTHVIETHGLNGLHVRDRAVACQVDCDGVQVHLQHEGVLRTQAVVLAMGVADQPRWPSWAGPDQARVHHVFEPGFNGWPERPQESIAVIGGGISACQVALRLHSEGHQVSLVSRHAFREHQFDSAPGWLGPKLMAGFTRVRDFDRRRALIGEARHSGSTPPEVLRDLRRALGTESGVSDALRYTLLPSARTHRTPSIIHLETEVQASTPLEDGVHLRLANGQGLRVDRVLLATGFSPHRPGGPMVDELVASASLPCASCGYPVVDTRLRWHPRIFVSGPLAELEIGPVARNIAGARRAADRIVYAARARPTERESVVAS